MDDIIGGVYNVRLDKEGGKLILVFMTSNRSLPGFTIGGSYCRVELAQIPLSDEMYAHKNLEEVVLEVIELTKKHVEENSNV